MSQKILEIKNLDVTFGGTKILYDLNLEIKEGEFVALIGLNGSGKSTLLKTIIGYFTPSKGSIDFHGSKIGYVPQKLFFDRTIPITVKEFLEIYNQKGSDFDFWLERLGVSDLKDHLMGQLSGGQLQKILLVNALVKEPDLLLLDEPTAGVDITSEAGLYELLSEINKDRGITTLLVSHDIHMVTKHVDKVYCLNGHICCVGKPLEVIDDTNFQEIFGKDLTLYKHDHEHTH